MSSWSGLDFFIFFIFFVNTMLGMSRGATKEIISFMCLSVALIFTIEFTGSFAGFMNSSPGVQDVLSSQFTQNFMASLGWGQLTAALLNQITYCLSLLICFIGIFTAGEAVLGFTGAVEVFSFPYAALNRKVGAGLGCTRGYILAVIVVLVFNHLSTDNITKSSYFISLFQNAAGTLDELIAKKQPEEYKEMYRDKDLYNEGNMYNLSH